MIRIIYLHLIHLVSSHVIRHQFVCKQTIRESESIHSMRESWRMHSEIREPTRSVTVWGVSAPWKHRMCHKCNLIGDHYYHLFWFREFPMRINKFSTAFFSLLVRGFSPQMDFVLVFTAIQRISLSFICVNFEQITCRFFVLKYGYPCVLSHCIPCRWRRTIFINGINCKWHESFAWCICETLNSTN